MSRSRRYGVILRLGLPILVGQLGMIVVGFADTIMVGRYSTEALAAASFVNNVFNMAILSCLGMTMGITPIAGALYAQRDSKRTGEVLRSAVRVNALYCFVVMAVMTVLYFNLDNLGQPAELLPLIRPYYLIYLAGMVPVTAFNVWAQWCYAINRTRMPMWVILGANVLNIAGNWLLIYGECGFPELGLTGAGWATLAGRVAAAAAIISIVMLKGDYREYATGFLSGHPSRGLTLRVGRTSLPVALQMAFESGSFTAAAVMVGWLGAIDLAAFQVMLITGTLGFCIYYSVAAAVAVTVANAAGNGDQPLMRKMAFSGYHIILALAAGACCAFIFGGRTLISLFTEDARVMSAALAVIGPLVLYQLCDATQITFANSLRGSGNVLPMVYISFVSYVIIGLPATYLLGFTAGMGLYGVVLSFSVSLFAAALLFLYYFLRTTSGRMTSPPSTT